MEQTRRKLHLPKGVDLLEWAQQQEVQHEDAGAVLGGTSASTNDTEPLLVIGVKTAVLTNFAHRQAIRETWGQRAKQLHVEVIFLGCVPVTSDIPQEIDRKQLQDAVKMERTVYRDLLTEELECEDSYRSLARKVRGSFTLRPQRFHKHRS